MSENYHRAEPILESDEFQGFFNPTASLAVTSCFLDLAGGRLNDLFLAKLHYIAERRSLTSIYQPIIFDRGSALKWGPVLLGTYALFRTPAANPEWKDVVSFNPWDESRGDQSANTVELIERFDYSSEMSSYQIRLLNEIFSEFKPLLDEGEKQVRSHKDYQRGERSEKGLQKAGYMLHDWCLKHFREYAEVWRSDMGQRSFPIRWSRVLEIEVGGQEKARDIIDSIRLEARFEREFCIQPSELIPAS